MQPGEALQKLIFERLTADAGVVALVGDRVYDNPPAPKLRVFPDITFGPSDAIEDDAECISGRVETIQIDCWARVNGKLGPVKPIMDAVRSALHLYDGNMTGAALVEMRVTFMRAIKDPDGLTAHGVVTVQAIIEEAA